jgi:hypothetical protein
MTATASLERLFRAIANHDHSAALSILERKPSLTMDAVRTGAARADAKAHFLTPIARYTYTGDTALHIAAAAYDATLVKRLLAMGADANARNRLGATPLHAASDGQPDGANWNPDAQVATLAELLAAGIDPNITDKRGVTPLHRAIRARCAAATRFLLEHGADPRRKNVSGSTPLRLATLTTGRSGSGSAAAKREQAEIIRLLKQTRS